MKSTGTNAKFVNGLHGGSSVARNGFGGNLMASKVDVAKTQRTGSGKISPPNGREVPAASVAGGYETRRMNHKLGSISHRIATACEAVGGMSMPELRASITADQRVIAATVSELVLHRAIVKAGYRGGFRYFARRADRDAWEAEHAAEIAAVLAYRALPEKERRREHDRKQYERKQAKRQAAAKTMAPRPKMSAEERKQRKAEQCRRAYEKQRAKLGLTVNARKPTGSPDIPTTPKKSKSGEPGRGRGIVIGSPRAFTVVTAQDKRGTNQQSNGEPIIPAHVKIQICPSGRDTRFLVDQSVAGRGVISQDFYERRLREQTR